MEKDDAGLSAASVLKKDAKRTRAFTKDSEQEQQVFSRKGGVANGIGFVCFVPLLTQAHARFST